MNLRDALEHYLSDKPRSAATLRRYRDNLRAHFAALGGDDRDVTEVTRAEVVAWRNAQDQLGLSPWTVAGHARDVKAFWAWLARAGLIAVSPAATLKVPQFRPRSLETLAISTEALQRVLLMARADPRNYAIVRFLADTGCRRAALCSLRLDRLNLDAQIATLVNKGGSLYDVSLSSRAVGALAEYLPTRPQVAHPFVFTSKRPPYPPLTPIGLSTFWRRLCLKAGLNGHCGLHSVRHHFAVRLARAGVNMAYIQDALGHTDMKTTRLYVRVLRDKLLEAVEDASLPDP